MPPNQSIPRLKDVAAKAEVSIAAASRILRGDTARFGEATTERVMSVAKELGWRPNLLVEGMQTGQTRTVGVLIPPYDTFWIGVLTGIHQRLAVDDFLPITVWLGSHRQSPQFEEDHSQGIRLINRLLDRRVDGLIMWPQIAIAFRKKLAEISRRDTPIAIIDKYFEMAGDRVITDEKKAAYSIADYLISLGHRRIGVLSERKDSASHQWAAIRSNHFRKAVRERLNDDVCMEHADSQNDLSAAMQLLNMSDRPTAIFAVSDHMARLVYLAAEQLGISVPDQVSVIGFGDLDFSCEMIPPLATYNQASEKIGRAAAELILNRIDRSEDSRQDVTRVVEGDLILRGSTAVPVCTAKLD